MLTTGVASPLVRRPVQQTGGRSWCWREFSGQGAAKGICLEKNSTLPSTLPSLFLGL